MQLQLPGVFCHELSNQILQQDYYLVLQLHKYPKRHNGFTERSWNFMCALELTLSE